MQIKGPPKGVQPVRKGDHWRDTNAAAHEQAMRRVLDQFKVVNRLSDKDTPPLGENPVQQGRAAAARVFAQYRDAVAFAVLGVAQQRVRAQEFGRDDQIEMRASGPSGQVVAFGVGDVIKRSDRVQVLDLRDAQIKHGGVAADLVKMQVIGLARCSLAAVLIGAKQGRMGGDPGLAVHRIGVGPWVRGQRGGVDGEGLIFELEIEIGLQVTCVNGLGRRVELARGFAFDVPPPLFDRVQTALADLVIQLGQKRCGGGDVGGGPAEGGLGEEPLKVPRAGLHAAPAHRAALVGDPVDGTFLAVRFPNFIAVEHFFRPGGDRPRRALAGAFVAGFAELLQTKVDGLVMGDRQGGGDHAGFQARAEEGIEDHFADARDFAQARKQQKRRLQHVAIHHRMRFGRVAQVAQVLRHHATQHRKPQIGPHGLRDGDPIVARRPLHRVKALVDDKAQRLVMRRGDRGAGGVMAVPRPIRAGRETRSIGSQKIACRLEVRGIAGAVCHRRGGIVHWPVLQQDQRPQQTALRGGRSGFHHMVPAFHGVLHLWPHVAELPACEKIPAFRHARHVRRVDIGGRLVHPLQSLEWVRPCGIVAPRVWVGIAGADAAMGAQLPMRAFEHRPRLIGQRGKRHIGREIHVGGNNRQPETRAHPRSLQCVVFPNRQPRRHGQLAEVHIGGGGGVHLGREAQLTDVFRQHGGVFGAAQAGALGLGVDDPIAARLTRARVTGVGGEDHQRVAVTVDCGFGRVYRVAQVRHDDIHPGGERLGLAAAQSFSQLRGTFAAAGRG